MSLVSLVNAHKSGSTLNAIQKSLDLVNFRVDKKINNIIIKPNMCYYWDYTTGETTNPAFVEDIISYLRSQYSKDINISVVESDASAMKCNYAFRMLGYENMSKRSGVNLVNISTVESEKQKVNINNNSYEFDIPVMFKEADLLINVPKIKYMGHNVKMSCALKNIFGCNPNYRKHVYHNNLNEVIVALNKLIKTDVCILDGLIVTGIKSKKINLVMSSTDPVALDAVACRILNINPRKVDYLRLAEKEKIGSLNYVLKGDDIEYFRNIYPHKTLESNFYSFGYQMIKLLGLQRRMGLE